MLKLLAQPDTLVAVSLVFGKHLIDLSHLDASLDLVHLKLTFVKLATLLSNRTLVAVDELLSLLMCLIGHISWSCSASRHLSHTHLLRLNRRMEHLLLLLVVRGKGIALRESSPVHVFEKFVFLNELVFQHVQLCVYLSVLVFEAIDLNLGVNVLLVEIFSRLERNSWHFPA